MEDYRGRNDLLGQTRNLLQGSADRPEGMVYGRSSAHALKGRTPVGVGAVIKGKYSDQEQRPDIDLGKSITPGFRNDQEPVRVSDVLHCNVLCYVVLCCSICVESCIWLSKHSNGPAPWQYGS